jgi:hypothetical protein
MAIAWEDVVTIAPAMSAVSLSAQAMILALISETIDDSDDAWGSDALFTMGASLLAAHYGSLVLGNSASAAQGPVTGMTLGPASKSFASPMNLKSTALAATSYGREYLALAAQLPSAYGFVS